MHYDDIYEEAHEEEFRMERIASENRKQLLDTLNAEEMIRIMFQDYLYKLPNYKIDDLKREYIDSRM